MESIEKLEPIPHNIYIGVEAERMAINRPKIYDVFLALDTSIWYRWNVSWGVIARDGVMVALTPSVINTHGFATGFDQQGYR